jgi:hypothetical protein
MNNHAAILRTLESFNQCDLYLQIELAKHPIEAMEKNRLSAALLFLRMTNDYRKLQQLADIIFDTQNIVEVVKLADDANKGKI